MDAFIRTEILRLNQQLAALVTRGQIAEALQAALQICDVIRRNLGEDDPLLASALLAVGDVHASASDLAAAETLYQEAVETGTRAWGEEHLSFASLLEKLARVKAALGKHDEALALHRRAVETRRKTHRRERAPSSTKPARTGEVLSSRGAAASVGGESEREDGGLRTIVPPLARLPARGLPARFRDFCQALAARRKRRGLLAGWDRLHWDARPSPGRQVADCSRAGIGYTLKTRQDYVRSLLRIARGLGSVTPSRR